MQIDDADDGFEVQCVIDQSEAIQTNPHGLETIESDEVNIF